MADRNPHLPEPPADGRHQFGEGPADLGGNRRCDLCGVYKGSAEAVSLCRGEYAESAKMRAWAANRWREDKVLAGGPCRAVAQIITRQIGARRIERAVLFSSTPTYHLLLECGHERCLDEFATDEDPAEGYAVYQAFRHGHLTEAACVESDCPMGRLEEHLKRNTVRDG